MERKFLVLSENGPTSHRYPNPETNKSYFHFFDIYLFIYSPELQKNITFVDQYRV